MTSLFRHNPTGRIIDTSQPLSDADYEMIVALHGNLHSGDGILECISEHGGELLVKFMRNGTIWAVHFRGEGHGCGGHPIVRMTDQHRRQRDYLWRAADDHGLDARYEYRTDNHTRPDVAVFGSAVNLGFEAQWSPITIAKVKRRTTLSYRSSDNLIVPWYADSGTDPCYQHYVPTLRGNNLNWNERLPNRGASVLTSAKRVDPLRCTPLNFDRCPDGKKSHCRGMHPGRSALTGLTVDDAVGMLACGLLVPMRWRGMENQVHIVRREDLELYRDLTGDSGVWVPGGKARAPQPDDDADAVSRACRSTRKPESAKLAPPPSVSREIATLVPRDTADRATRMPDVEAYKCQRCGESVHRLESLAFGLCKSCRVATSRNPGLEVPATRDVPVAAVIRRVTNPHVPPERICPECRKRPPAGMVRCTGCRSAI